VPRLPEWQHAECEPHEGRENDGNAENAAVDGDGCEPRNLGRREQYENAQCRYRKSNPERRSNQRQDSVLDDELAGETGHFSAKGRTDGNLSHAHRAARQQQIGDVDACDEQHEGRGGEQHDQRRLDGSEDHTAKRLDEYPACLVDWIRSLEVGGNCRELVLRGSNIGAGREASDDQEGVRVARKVLLGGLDRLPHVNLGAGVAIGKAASVVGGGEDLQHAEISSRRNHADNRPWAIVDVNGATDDARVALEYARPQTLADHQHRGTAGPVILSTEHSPRDRRDAEQRRKPMRDKHRRHPRRLAGIERQHGFAGHERPESIEAAAALFEIDQVRPRTRLTEGPGIAIGLPDHDQARRLGQRYRPQQHRVDDTEDRGRDADAECERQQGGGGEARVADEEAGCEPDVGREVGQHATTDG
jgi:hypothetical protein